MVDFMVCGVHSEANQVQTEKNTQQNKKKKEIGNKVNAKLNYVKYIEHEARKKSIIPNLSMNCVITNSSEATPIELFAVFDYWNFFWALDLKSTAA